MRQTVPAPAPASRRQRRRQETIEEVLGIAVAIMAEQGVAGLSTGEIARRMGIRPPSLYGYFPSKHALYDALFARGAKSVLAAMSEVLAAPIADGGTLAEVMHRAGEAFVRWSLEHPAYSQLLFWRPVPGFTPSPEAYEPALELVGLSMERFARLQRLGLLRRDVPAELIHRDWTILIAGVVSQQLSNEPGEDFGAGRFTAALPGLAAMFARHYEPPATSAPTGRGTHADRDRPDR
ncbi:MAG TPA: TetR/AcrR family transcriptional regulator [Streptosporangiaceae bacterium]|nr:TetR/AcrR family transcriptional regulator [Streptosporangiaceae bacterium]